MFRDFQYARQVQQYQGLPIDEVKALGDKLDVRYKDNLTNQDQLEMMIDNLEVRDINSPHVQKALENAKGRLAQIREKGNWEDAEFLVKQAQKEFTMDKGVRGALKDKAAYDAWTKSLEERHLKGDVDPETYAKTKKLAAIKNTNPVEYDAQTGEYKNIFSGYTPMNYQDIQKAMFELGEKWKASKGPIDLEYKDASGNVTKSQVKYDPLMKGYLIVGTEKYLSEAELQAGLTQAVMANPMYKAFVEEGLMLDKALKFGDKADVQTTHLFSTNPADKALLNVTEDKAKEMIKELGYDPDEVLADPAMREALYDQISMMKKVKSYVDPAASAYSFSETENQYLTDVVLMESIKHANKLREQAQAHQFDMIKQRDAQDFELKNKENPIHVANPGVVVPGPEFDITKTKESLSDNKSALAKLKKQLETQKTANPKGNYATLTKQINDLQSTISVQEGTLEGVRRGFLTTPAGQAKVEAMWKKYQSNPGFGMNGIKTKEDFVKHLAGEETVQGTVSYSPFIGVFQEGYDALFGSSKRQEERRQTADASALNVLQREYNQLAQTYVTTGGELPGVFGNVLWGGLKSVELEVSEKVLTPFVMNNMTNYTVSGGANLATFYNKLAKDNPDIELDAQIAITDGEQINGQFPQYITVKNKKTGEIISRNYIYPKSGGADIRYTTGIRMMNQAKPGEEAHTRGNYMAASATFLNWNPTAIANALNTVSDDDPIGTSDYSEPMELPTQQGTIVVKIKKERMPAYDNQGNLQGANTRFQIVQVNPDTGELTPYTVLNPQFRDQNAAVSSYLSSEDYNKLSPSQKNYLAKQQSYYNSFANQQDAQVALFNYAFPDAAKLETQVVKYGTSSTNTEIKKTSKPVETK